MKQWIRAVLYSAALAGANFALPAAAEGFAAAEALRAGDMRKLMFHADPKPVPGGVVLTDTAGATGALEDYRGQWVLLNFWATWCAPCRKEMPMLEALQADRGGHDFAVVTVAAGRNSPAGIDRFFAEIGVTALPKWMDPRDGLAAQMAVMGLPVTLLIDPEGREVARMLGEADWSSENARAVLEAAMAGG